jgi:putative ABC transport system permease protein
MRIPRIAKEGIRALGNNKLRTFFMMVGTIAGVAALVVIMAVGKGTEKKVNRRMQNFGPDAMMLIAGGGKDMPPPDMNVTTLTLEDAEAVRSQIDGLKIVSPMAWRFRMNVKHETNQYQAIVWGVEPSWHEAWKWYPAEGEEISDEDAMARVCLIGRTIQRELFGDRPAIGERIYVNKVALTVKGVLETRGTSPMGGDFDNKVVLPITTAMRRVMNCDYVGAIRIITEDPGRMSDQADAIHDVIRQRHGINRSEEDDFRIVTAVIIARLARGTARTLSMLLMALAGLSLIVGGVVLMNILLISVAERTQEIGLRRAVGATRRDIFVQFLAESLAVTLLGMLLGSLIGLGVSFALARLTPIMAIPSWEPFLLALAFALLVGTFFGVQPARRAARLRPVEALR